MSTIDLNLIKKLLLTVEKPSRYTGGEFNTPDVKKPHRASFCFCFPDIYEIGMSNLGLQTTTLILLPSVAMRRGRISARS